MVLGKIESSGCILYWIYRRTGLTPIETNLSKRDLLRPALAVSRDETTGPS